MDASPSDVDAGKAIVAAGLKTHSTAQTLVAFFLKYGMIIALVFLVVFFSIATPRFMSVGSLTDILRSVSIVAIIALGVTLSLVVNGFDLSVGSVSGLAVVAAAGLMVFNNQGTLVAVLVPLVLGMLVGLVNAFLIVKVRIPDILATLGTLFLLQGVQLTYSKGYPIYTGVAIDAGKSATGKFQPAFLAIGQGYVGPVPIPVIVMLVTVICVHVFLTNTRFGRFLYVTGGNPEAARLSGIRVGLCVTAAYAGSGFLAALGGIVLASRLGMGDTLAGTPLLLDAVAASFIGFAVLGAGKPNVFGTFFGAVFMGVMLTGMTMMNVPYYMQDIFKGLVLIGALSLSFYMRKRRVAG